MQCTRDMFLVGYVEMKILVCTAYEVCVSRCSVPEELISDNII